MLLSELKVSASELLFFFQSENVKESFVAVVFSSFITSQFLMKWVQRLFLSVLKEHVQKVELINAMDAILF